MAPIGGLEEEAEQGEEECSQEVAAALGIPR